MDDIELDMAGSKEGSLLVILTESRRPSGCIVYPLNRESAQTAGNETHLAFRLLESYRS